ncbi:sigma-70 family RNA polymerase sigma factor [Indiicoccus explosivorum]|uniref:sigma-70 family RNA polymerase sigma factor n=1 Tax=Indiicoccus explosivorum TaxID=1917864 RepID=UPI000B43C839|nr:sigma-70 family RNA polymerase sigma factor [Indiicoccus explosivorum]
MDIPDRTENISDSKSAEEWLEVVMDDYGESLTRLAFTYLKDWEMAQDVVQEVFVTVFQQRHTYSEIKSFKAWIYRITINRCKDILKSSWQKRVVMGTRFFNLSRSETPSPEQLAVSRSEEEALLGHIFKLPVKYREVLLLYYYQNLTIPEISQLLSLQENTIKTRMRRGKNRLKTILEGRGF